MTLREDRERIAMGLMAYKEGLNFDPPDINDLYEYNYIELLETDDLAKRMELDPSYYQPECDKRLAKLRKLIPPDNED